MTCELYSPGLARSTMQVSLEHQPKSSRLLGERAEIKERVYKFADLSRYPLGKRSLICLADLVFYSLIRLIGRTVRFQIEGQENWEAASRGGLFPIYTFWHNCVFLAVYFFRRRRIVVMTSQSLDGEYIARFIQRFGYGAARGSSTRGSTGALIEMIRLMRAGCPAGFTIDGPKGPRYVAKMGAALLAKKTGNPMLPFTVTPISFWQVSSWDRLQVPKPFTRARVDIASPIFVPPDANEATLAAKREELQRALEELNRRGDEWRATVGG